MKSPLAALLRRVRRDPCDIEAIHDARVAARRTIAAGGPERRLSKLIRRLGRVRNLDVTLQLLGSDAPNLTRRLRRRRRSERARLSRWLRGYRLKPFRPLYLRPRDLAAHFERVKLLTADPSWWGNDQTAHEVRREVRRLRFAHETLRESYAPAEFRRHQAAFVEVQDLAGAWQDRCVLVRLAEPKGALRRRLRREVRTLARRFAARVARLRSFRGAACRPPLGSRAQSGYKAGMGKPRAARR